MEIVKNIPVPTGNILIVRGKRGLLECLSIGDYGKEQNVKADFMGLSRRIEGVPHGPLLPLEEKWVVTISSQYGCSMGCRFCDVPAVGPGVNASVDDIANAAVKNGFVTTDGYEFYYPYREFEERLRGVGFDVIVFVPSLEEDESRITCGNAILAEATQ